MTYDRIQYIQTVQRLAALAFGITEFFIFITLKSIDVLYYGFLTTSSTISGRNLASSIIGRRKTSTISINVNFTLCFIIDVTEDPLLLPWIYLTTFSVLS